MILIIILRLEDARDWCVRDAAGWTDVHAVRRHARGHWIHVLAELAPALEQALERLGRHVACPVHGGRDGFRLFRDARETGGGICNTCGAFSDGFALLMWMNGWRFSDALRAVAATLPRSNLDCGPSLPVPRRSKPDRMASSAWRRAAIEKVWVETLDPDDPSAEPLRRYLAGRSLHREGLAVRTLRFHPGLPYWESGRRIGRYPAMIAPVTSPTGELITLHRTYLTEDGRKAPVAAPRKLMAYPEDLRLAGSAIRLEKAGAELGITEGIETALAVILMTGEPTWAATSAGMLERFEPPPDVEALTVWADRDRSGTGERSARILADRMSAHGLAAEVRLPEIAIPESARGVDWGDVLRAGSYA
ncbi:DUF7146 domain-containing protein [Thiocapsa rosea]|uniref:Phage/plasmid primase-like uncharacterized protein n=1 Tax=Thiocapsa rosea TaxID=69360 RepID=A0A495VCF8_9GAMM|nr:toprim domain-containing protein [Thiocapsa rosea]RKT47019.1 phage/plasmid primase-like uncharacterized protein [Thiocapsa rosea]